jgi:serine/threonine-protein kinase
VKSDAGITTVYLARDVKHNRHVALKVLDPERGAVLGAERFLSEIRVTAGLQHPNLLPLFDSGEAEGLLFYVMPYVEGESLRHRLEREKQLPVDEAVRIGISVCGALAYAHQHVIHRDLARTFSSSTASQSSRTSGLHSSPNGGRASHRRDSHWHAAVHVA